MCVPGLSVAVRFACWHAVFMASCQQVIILGPWSLMMGMCAR